MASATDVSLLPAANVESSEGPKEEASNIMRTFVRVKRHIDDDPATSLILSFKKQKIGSELSEEKSESFEFVNSVLKFAGSIQPQEEIELFVKTLDEQSETSAKESLLKTSPVKAPTPSSSARRQKTQNEIKRKSSACRYKIINTKRGLDEIANAADSESKETDETNYLYSMFDLIDDGDPVRKSKKVKPDFSQDDVITCNGAPMVQLQNPLDYVFDVYTIATPLSVESQHVNVEHLWENCFEPLESDEESNGREQDDSDSNDENHRGNDYPDEESDASDDCDGSDREEFDDSDDGEANAAGAGWMKGSKAMKELSLHVKTLKLDGRPSVRSQGDSSEDEMGGVYGGSDDEVDFDNY